MSKSLVPNDKIPNPGRDNVQTPPALAKAIIDHFAPSGRILDPCRGDGAFYNQYPANCIKQWCEVAEGRDFLTYDFGGQQFDWILTNLPWGQFRAFLKRSMDISDNIVFLCLTNAWFMKARQQDMKEAGFGMVEILNVVQPERPWPSTGFCLSATWVRKGWNGAINISHL